MSDTFEEWVDQRLPAHGLSGSEVLTDCPWCGRPKLYVNRQKGVFYCQRCRERGRSFKLVAKVEGVDIKEAEGRLRPQPGSSDDLLGALTATYRIKAADQVALIRHPLPAQFVPCFDGEFWRVPSYVEDPMSKGGRELSDDMLIRHGIGYATEGRYRDRCIVPVIQGGQRAFVARLMGRPKDHRWRSSTGEMVEPPKYLAPKDSGLGTMLYWFDGIAPNADLILVEGVFDAMRLIDLGFSGVATFGKHLSARQRSLIVKAKPNSVTFFRDDDATADGWAEALTLARTSAHLIVKVATCPAGHDPDSLGTLGRTAVQAVLDSAEDAADPNASLLAALKSVKKR